jgi:hypothetical protein
MHIEATGPVSFLQENRLSKERNLGGGRVRDLHYVMSTAIDLGPDPDRAALATVLREVVQRQRALRTSFAAVDGTFEQRVHAAPRTIPVVEHVVATRDDALAALRREHARPFPPDARLFLRPVLLRRPGSALLVLLVEHLAADAGSLDVLNAEVRRAYFRTSGPSPVDPVPYHEWAAEQRAMLATDGPRLTAFWRDLLGPAGPLPPNRLFHPLDGIERAPVSEHVRSFDGGRAALEELCTRHRMSPFMALLAITQLALADVSGDPVVVHSPIANRTRREASTVGWFAHSLPFPAAPAATSTLGEAFQELRQTILRCVRHHAMPLPAIVLALAPRSHGTARALRPPRFFLSWTDREEPSPDDLPFDESELLGDAQRWAEPGLSVYWSRDAEHLTAGFHWGEGRIEPATVQLVGTTIAEILHDLCHQPDRPWRRSAPVPVLAAHPGSVR